MSRAEQSARDAGVIQHEKDSVALPRGGLADRPRVPVLPGFEAAQGGDQFLDGIGETALVARYVLNGNTEDSSRNHFHAALRGSGGAFVEDARFGRALELSGNGSHVQLPGNALTGEDTISVTGWLYLPTGASGPDLRFRAERRQPGCSRP